MWTAKCMLVGTSLPDVDTLHEEMAIIIAC